jgi:hypothetical protein
MPGKSKQRGEKMIKKTAIMMEQVNNVISEIYDSQEFADAFSELQEMFQDKMGNEDLFINLDISIDE